jgi:hypothetical protein
MVIEALPTLLSCPRNLHGLLHYRAHLQPAKPEHDCRQLVASNTRLVTLSQEIQNHSVRALRLP